LLIFILGRREYHYYEDLNMFVSCRQEGTMVTYGGMSKKPVTVSTPAFIVKVRL
jgi:hypothetical protein